MFILATLGLMEDTMPYSMGTPVKVKVEDANGNLVFKRGTVLGSMEDPTRRNSRHPRVQYFIGGLSDKPTWVSSDVVTHLTLEDMESTSL